MIFSNYGRYHSSELRGIGEKNGYPPLGNGFSLLIDLYFRVLPKTNDYEENITLWLRGELKARTSSAAGYIPSDLMIMILYRLPLQLTFNILKFII